MKKFWEKYKKVLILVALWRAALFCIEKAAPGIIPLHDGYNGPIPWANHDGIHYLRIAQIGYFNLSEAFFPLYPFFISVLSRIVPFPPYYIASFFSFAAFTAGILFLYNFLLEKNSDHAWWTILFIVTFPTSFFFSAVYSEGLFFFLTVLVLVFCRKKQWFWVGVYGALASATRVFGVLLFVYACMEYISSRRKVARIQDILSLCLMPTGLVAYMLYLYTRSGDPFLFFHIQPAFGANRSGSELILLPQVIWRYLKILFTAFLQPTPASYFISVIEFITVIFGYIVLLIGWKKKEPWPFILYGVLALTLPTLTGTFSSLPRYALSIFPLFFILGKLDNTTVKYSFIVIFFILEVILSLMFLRGWFVA